MITEICYEGCRYKDKVEHKLKYAFIDDCQKMDIPASQVLRQHMKRFVQNLQQKNSNFTVSKKNAI